MVFVSGSGDSAVYRVVTESEIGQLSRLAGEVGIEEMVWVLVYRYGPLSEGVQTYNRERGLTAQYEQVVVYAGQCILERDLCKRNGTGENDDA
jgi:hypothetical protein